MRGLSLERVATRAPRSDKIDGFSKIPVKADLSLPDAIYHSAGTADLEYDPRALVWLRRGKCAYPDASPPPATVIPVSTRGPRFDIGCGRVRFWTVAAVDHEAARLEMIRLADRHGYAVRDLWLRRAVSAVEPRRSASGRMQLLTNVEVRAKLGLDPRP